MRFHCTNIEKLFCSAHFSAYTIKKMVKQVNMLTICTVIITDELGSNEKGRVTLLMAVVVLI